ncbi:MAG: VWA domain-containing protein [Thermoanaerobaculia bacterium]|nr:VWA domain-containing protein [Thermoanaerobaculia bacterium]
MITLAGFAAVLAGVPAQAQHACVRGLGMENQQIWWTGGKNSKFVMDFTSGSPRLGTDGIGQTRSIETTAVYTTARGELLVYTDGNVIFDGRSHEEIGRGVGGNPSSTEAALIVPAPGGDPTNDFYVFGNTANTTGEIQYTRVDLATGSIGEIVVLDGGRIFGESLGTVPHADGNDFWILSVTHRDPAVAAYRIGPTGVSQTGVLSPLTDLPDGATANRGSIVYHPPTGRLAFTFYSSGSRGPLLYTADFDEATGEASGFRRFDHGGYGVAFSPDGSKLYFALNYGGPLDQLDRETGEVHRVSTSGWAMPRLAPDGKVYVVAYNRTSMGVLHNPDASFDALRWEPKGVELPEGARTAYSLPNQVYAPCVVNYPEQPLATGSLALAVAEGVAAETLTPETLEVVLDMSGSMWGQVEGRAKYLIAREIVATTVRELPAEVEVGVRVYSHRSGACSDSELLAPIGRADRRALVDRIGELVPGQGKTPIGYSLEQVAADLAGREGGKAIVLVSDGLETCGGDPVSAARALCEAGVGMRVHTVGFDVGGAPEAVEQLRAVAEAGCGRFVSAGSADELRSALRTAGSTSFTVTDSASGERWTGTVGGARLEVAAGTYRLRIDGDPPTDLGEVRVEAGEKVTLWLERGPEGLRAVPDGGSRHD